MPKYPNLEKSISADGARRPPSGAAYDLDSGITINILFGLASKNLSDAGKLLAEFDNTSNGEQVPFDAITKENAKLKSENKRLMKENTKLQSENDVLKEMLKKGAK